MSYGIYDCDLLHGSPMFNLELMKLSSYYKSKGEIVAYSSRFTPERYNHFIIGKDRIDERFNFPIHLYNNLEMIGRFFSPKKYYPMKEAIEKQIPDTYLYKGTLKRIDLKPEEVNFYTSQLKAEHIRLSLDGENIWKDYEKQLHYRYTDNSISIYDYNIAKVEGAQEILKELVDLPHRQTLRPLLLKFPIQVKKATDLETWMRFRYYGNYVAFMINGKITQEDIDFLKENKNFFRNKTVYYNISSSYITEDFISNINTIYRHLYFLRTILTNFLLIYDEEFFSKVEWKTLIKILNLFSLSYNIAIKRKRIPYVTLFKYIKYRLKSTHEIKGLDENDIKQCFYYMAQHNYELFKDFYEYKGEDLK